MKVLFFDCICDPSLWPRILRESSGLKLRLKLTQMEKRWKCINKSVADRESNGEQRLIHPPLQLRRLLPSSIKIHPMIVKSELVVFVFLLCLVIKQTISLINFEKTSRRQMITTHFINHRVCHKSRRLRAFASETIWLKTLLCRVVCPCCEWSHQSTNVHLIWLSFFFCFYRVECDAQQTQKLLLAGPLNQDRRIFFLHKTGKLYNCLLH